MRDRGNPTTELQCEKAIAEARNLLKESHSVCGNIQLTPAQVRSIRKSLFESGGGGSMYNMQTYVMLLLGINLFLRASEVITLGFDNFQMNAAKVEVLEHRVDSLVLWIKGKNDAEKVFFRLYRDDDNPEFCPIRHLLCYIQSAGLKGGCLFPEWDLLSDYLDDPSSGDGVFDLLTQHVQYQNFLDRMQVSQSMDCSIYILLSVYMLWSHSHHPFSQSHRQFWTRCWQMILASMDSSLVLIRYAKQPICLLFLALCFDTSSPGVEKQVANILCQ